METLYKEKCGNSLKIHSVWVRVCTHAHTHTHTHSIFWLRNSKWYVISSTCKKAKKTVDNRACMSLRLIYCLETVCLWKIVKNFTRMKSGRKECESSRPAYYRVELPHHPVKAICLVNQQAEHPILWWIINVLFFTRVMQWETEEECNCS